jgi:TatD DNase family protein
MAKEKPPIPISSESIIETHCHLDYLKEHELEHTLAECQRVGIEKIVTIAVSPDNLSLVRDLITKSSMIYGTQGIHPHEAKSWTPQVYEEIDQHLSHERIVAVGEIGLDYHYSKSPHDEQIKVFKTQLELAIKHDLPVVIHTRDADDDTAAILKEYAPQMKRKGVVHSFTSGLELGLLAQELGFHLGFNGIITFKNADNVREVLEATPLEKILVETDSPFLTPVPYRGVENNPFYLPFIIDYIAKFKGVTAEQVAQVTTTNAHEVFNL